MNLIGILMRIRHLPWQRSAGTSISPIESASRRIPGARMPIRMSCIWGWVRAFTASLLSASGGMRFAFLTYVRCFTGRCRVEKAEALSAVGAGGMAECARRQAPHFSRATKLRTSAPSLFRVNGTVGAGADQRADVVRPGNAREPLIENVGGDPLCYMERCLQDPALRRVDQPDREVLVGNLFRHRLRGDNKHLLRHPGSLGSEHCHAHRREDVDVVPLTGHEFMARDLDRRERAAASENRPAVGPAIG